jgi:integrase/recombinase XerD
MTFDEGLNALLAHLRLAGYRPATIRNYGDQLKRFGEWLHQSRMDDLRTLTRARLLVYQTAVRSERIGPETQALRIRAVKRLYGYLVTQGHLLLDPTEGIQEISRRQALPKPVLSTSEAKRLLSAPVVSRPLGVRDRALLEVLYATGARVGELERVVSLDVDLQESTLHLRHTKGGQPRVVPLGHHATHWLRRYLHEVRPQMVRHRPFETALFVVRGGRALRQYQIRALLKQYGERVGIRKTLTPHVLRHSCATHLMQAGADLRAIQELLGHARLSSTVLYTRVAPLDVKSSHERYHPGSHRRAAD